MHKTKIPAPAEVPLPDTPTSECPTEAPESDGPPLRHLKYYIDDEMAIFLVQNRLFKVHRYFLIRESEIFHWMFTCPPGKEGAEGGTDEHSIPLHGVTCFEFESLLDFFYNGMHVDYRPTLETWIQLLSISTRYDMEKIRIRAISRIDRHRPLIDPVDKILLAEKYDIPEWLAQSYARLCQRVGPLEEFEGEKLGLRTSIKLARAREAVRQGSAVHSPVPTPLPTTGRGFFGGPPLTPRVETPPAEEYEPYSHSEVMRIVKEVFWPPVSSDTSSNSALK